MKISLFAVVTAVFALTVPTVIFAQDAEVPVAGDFAGIGYSINTSSDIFVYAGLRDIGGRVGVCGAIWTEGATNTAKFLERQATRKIKFNVAGQRLRVNTDKFNRYDSRAEAETGLAGCSVTATTWQAGYAAQEVEMSLGSGSLRN